MSTVRSTLDRPVHEDVITLDTPLMRSVQRHPAGKGRPRPQDRRGAREGSPRRPAERRSAPYRLTRRGRVVVFLAALFACVGLTVGLGSQVIATSEKGDPIPSRAVTMQPGETLWDLASEANPGGDIRETLHDIARLNSLADPGNIPAGTKIYVPIY